MIDNPTENILDALENIAHYSIDIKLINDAIGGESTRVINIYSRFIGTEKEQPNFKSVYNKANMVCQQCNNIDNEITKLKNLIQDLLNTVAGGEYEKS